MKYNPKKTDKKIFEHWKANNNFKDERKGNKTFSIIMPPPNVTGKLHLGHAWNSYYPDLLIRFKHLKGFEAIWYPGLDHAGIATQAKVEKKIFEEQGLNRIDLGREKFLEQVWNWKEYYSNNIMTQWDKLGIIPNKEKIKFTLDNDVNKLVVDSFVDLYNKGLIYKGKRLINWDPVLKTAISNLEINEIEKTTKMYHIKYSIKDSKEFVIISTTRPETMFADKVAFVNPEDKRYKNLIGKIIINPANDEEMIIMADEYVSIDKGSGVMKATPAHDFNDYELGIKYGLEMITTFNFDGSLNELGGKYEGVDRLEVRKQLISEFKKQGIVEEEDHQGVSHISDRSGSPVEPMMSDQWFLKASDLSKDALKYQKEGNNVDFYPERFNETIERYFEDMNDWCISRQLWWGHRIPAWYKGDEMKVQIDSPGEGWNQDEDVLDTWYSSGLWPVAYIDENVISRSENPEYLSDVLFTGYDIILFWVSRMIFQSLQRDGRQPFKKAIIHGLVRAKDGKKMSKSLDNGIDPMDVIEKWGSDALRSFLLGNSTPGQDIKFNEQKINASWDLQNKLFNASKLLMMLNETKVPMKNFEELKLTKIDKYILGKLSSLLKVIDSNVEKYNLTIVFQSINDFIWNDFAGNYLEFIKSIKNNEQSMNSLYIFREILIALHPFLPFTTENIYMNLSLKMAVKESILKEDYPSIDIKGDEKFERELSSLIKAARTIDSMPERLKQTITLNVEGHKVESQLIKDIMLNSINTKIVNGRPLEAAKIFVFPKFGIVYATAKNIDNTSVDILLKNEIIFIESEIIRAQRMVNNEKLKINNHNKWNEESEKLIFYKDSLEMIK